MTRYKQTDFADEETSSIGSIHLNEVRASPNMHIRFANRVNRVLMSFPFLWINSVFHFPEYVSVAVGSSQQVGKVSLNNHSDAVHYVFYASHHISERSRDGDSNITCQATSIHG